MNKFILLFMLVLLTACGARKVVKTETETKTETKNETEKETVSETKKETVTNLDIKEKEEVITPVDPEKEVKKTTYEENGKQVTTWQNASVSFKEKEDRSIKKDVVEEKIKTLEKRKEEFKQEIDVLKKDIERAKSGFIFWLIICIVLGILIIIIYEIKRKRN